MTNFRIESIAFDPAAIQAWQQANQSHNNWPVVYTINNEKEIYVGETVNAGTRMLQHHATPGRRSLKHVQVILNDKFNKSACLDLESQLIRYFHADGKFKVLNGNHGITESDYFQRQDYQRSFDELFERLFELGYLTRRVPELINSNLFKYSPFKSLNADQAVALTQILETLLNDLDPSEPSELVVQGDPGTGKTIVAVYLIKLLMDISQHFQDEITGEDSMFAEYFSQLNKDLLAEYRIGLVIPQQSLRSTLKTVFAKTPRLNRDMILSPFDVGKDMRGWDLLIVDEAHRLGIRANQSSAQQNKDFKEINERLFGSDNFEITQLDWVRHQSRHTVLLIDSAQSIKPADLPKEQIDELAESAREKGRLARLHSQMRVSGGNDYIDFIQSLLSDEPQSRPDFGSYDLRFFDSFSEMKREIEVMEREYGLARLLSGFAFPWNSKKNKSAHDIEIEDHKLFWNRTATDWISSKTSVEEVGSIHTIQGYDLNYAGVIIGPDLTYDENTKRIEFVREKYFDVKGRENNKQLGREYSDEEIRQYVLNIYRVLLTRGIKGTFIYVSDPQLRSHLAKYL